MRVASIAVALVALAGCAVGPEYRPPEPNVPESWRMAPERMSASADAVWWEDFGDPVLDALIDEAIARNLDLAVAAARIEEFGARVGIVGAGRWPQLGYDGRAARARLSREIGAGAVPGTPRTADSFEANLTAAWELDLWGRIARAEAAAEAEFLAQVENRRALVLTLVSSVAETYVQLRALDAQLAVARARLAARRETMALFEMQLERGVLSELEVAQLRSELERTAAAVPSLERSVAIAENALSILLGRPPGALARGRSLTQLDRPAVPAGLPSDLLTRRPDLRAAERQLAAASEALGAERAGRFPRISLTGLLGLASADLSELASSSAGQSVVAGGVSGPLFTAGRVQAGIDAAEAALARTEAGYRAAVLTALREAEDALVVYATTQVESAAQDRRVDALRQYVEFAQMRYDNGYASYLAVLDAERSLFDAELLALQTRADALRALIGVYKAFGGGWSDHAPARSDRDGAN